MLGVLLESKAKRQRRTGGAAMSVAAHVAIIGLVTAFTVPKPRAAHEGPIAVPVVIAPESPPQTRTVEHRSFRGMPVGPALNNVDVRLPPPIMSNELAPIDVDHGPPLDSLLLNSRPSGGGSRSGLGHLGLTDDPGGGNEWRGTEAMMRVVTQSKPRYPESLRLAGIDGHVLVQFKVDTLGMVDPASVKFLTSAHELFNRAVREALGGFRFRPAEVDGHRVVALAEMPFEFSIRR
jgi:periplasmic protein TonB